MLEVRCSGGKTFYQRYRDSHGRERQFKIGSARAVTVRQARNKARSILAEAALGNDPQRKRELLRKIPTLAEFVRVSYLPFAKNVKRSWRTDDTVLRLHVLPEARAPGSRRNLVAEYRRDLRRMQENGYASGTTN